MAGGRVTSSTATVTTVATPPIVRSLLDEARKKGWTGGVLGIRAQPVWPEPAEFVHDGVPVRVVPCASALAAREALLARLPDHWLVVLTDRDDDDLGEGVTAHMIGDRLRSPDLWEAVRDRFQATRIDHRLRSRDLALGLLTATPADGWPPAPGGLLTPDHVYGSTAVGHLGVRGRPADVDRTAVLTWTTDAEAATRLASLRALAGATLADNTAEWVAERCGAVGDAVLPLLRGGRAADVVPLGLVARAVRQSPPGSGPRALLRQSLDVRVSSDTVLDAWAGAAEECATGLLTVGGNTVAAVLARADTLLTGLEAEAYAESSDVIGRGLSDRLANLGEALRSATERAATRAAAHGPDAVLADPERVPAVEAAWQRVDAHRLSNHPAEVRVSRAHAAVRLTRWLAGTGDLPQHGGLAEYVARHRDVDAWVDRAADDVWIGVDEPALARGLRSVVKAVRLRRDAHDLAFARVLAAHEGADEPAPPGVHHVEDLLADVVLPVAKTQPVLLVVADGMSVAAAAEIVDDVVGPTWMECTPAGQEHRVAALTLLPSLTNVSRTSLLSGERTVGEAKQETEGFAQLCRAHGLTGRLFHKQPLDASEGGYALAHDVATAVDDTERVRLVACVLNTIDDALDRSDPGGTEWTITTVKHLRSLLERARGAGRVVALTADHGHVIERREGHTLTARPTSSNRSRPAGEGPPAGDGEVRIRGSRVLLHGGDAVLAVDERLRYGPLKAGYHGGASPAEVVVPLCVLATGNPPNGWTPAPPQSPAWWRTSVTPVVAAEPAARPGGKPTTAPTLFDEEPSQADAVADLVAAVQRSAPYREQRRRAQRVPVDDSQLAGLLRALLRAPGHRLDPDSAASALGVATVNLAGALPMAQRLLNVEQYAVVSRDPDGVTVVLDENLLREQFGVG